MQTQIQNLTIEAELAGPRRCPVTGESTECWALTLRRTDKPDMEAQVWTWPGNDRYTITRRGLLYALLRVYYYAKDAAMSPDEFRSESAWWLMDTLSQDKLYDYCQSCRRALLTCLPEEDLRASLLHDLLRAIPNAQD